MRQFFDETGLSVPEPRLGDAVRTAIRSLSGLQKEARVASARSGLTWRLVSDEGPYLNGHDAAPCPLAILTVGMVSSGMNEIVALARHRGVELMLDISEQTCFLHAFCRTDLKTRLRVVRA